MNIKHWAWLPVSIFMWIVVYLGIELLPDLFMEWSKGANRG